MEYPMQGDGELNDSQIGGKMASVLGYRAYQHFPDFSAELSKFTFAQRPQVPVTIDPI